MFSGCNRRFQAPSPPVSADFVAKLCGLDAKNSQNELSIKKSLTKSEEAFFDTGGKDTWDQ